MVGQLAGPSCAHCGRPIVDTPAAFEVKADWVAGFWILCGPECFRRWAARVDTALVDAMIAQRETGRGRE